MTPGRRFAFRLALALGCPNVDNMLAGMPHAMLVEWMAFDQVEPLGTARRMETSLAALMALTANVNRGRRRRPFEVDDFLPVYGPPRERPAQQVWKELRLWAQLNGAKSKS